MISKVIRLNPLFILIAVFLITIPSFALADNLWETRDFYVNSEYDFEGRERISATLLKISPHLYFYIDSKWFNSLSSSQQSEVYSSLANLSQEFENKIYPTLVSYFGSEPKPGIDGDFHITVLVHPMKEKTGGYFNSGDCYFKAQYPTSNEREMFYLNATYLTSPQAKSYLSHEFLHLITFNQKEKILGVQEEIWLNELRSEIAPTILGYDDVYTGSNLQTRVHDFLSSPTDSLTEWQNKEADYGVLNLFAQYLVDNYGIDILIDSLKSEKTGILSLNESFRKKGFNVNFSQVFTDWTITVAANDCSLGEKYCYKNENLKNFRITPVINFLPIAKKSSLSATQTTKDWSGNWFKFIGGRGDLKIEFIGSPETIFKVPYLTQDKNGNYSLSFLQLDNDQKGEIFVPGFGDEIISLILIPSSQNKISGFTGFEPTYSFFWSASIMEEEKPEETEEIKALLAEIDRLKKEIALLQAKIQEILTQKYKCGEFKEDLYYGMRNNWQVKCLQEFLRTQGPEIYPEGLVTGNFLTLTKKAVIRFQEKYKEEILTPLGLQSGTGYFGSKTRAKVNQLLGY